MMGFLFLILLALLAAGIGGYYFYAWWSSRRQRIADILSDPHLLAQWVYAPDEWRRVAEEEFTWVKNKDSVGHVYISPTTLYIKNDSKDRLSDLSRDDGRVVTHVSYHGSDMNPLKLRVRWKIVRRHRNSVADEVKYYKEDFRVPVPLKYREEAERVVEFFTARLQNNLAAYTAVLPDDDPISIFGDDPF